MRKKNVKPYFFKTTLAGIAVLSGVMAVSTRPARAEVLEQKWQPGQQLSYDFKMDGVVRLTPPAEVPMVGGLPLEMLLKGDGQSTLETRAVDEFGVALVAPRLERMQLKFNETTFNQSGSLGIRDGRVNASLNGQTVGIPAMDWKRLFAPEYGLRITKSLRVTGLEPLKTELKTETTNNPPATDETTAQPAGEEPKQNDKRILPLNMPAMLQAMITRVIPPLLPIQDVKVGDTWSAVIQWPAVPGAPAVAGAPANAGTEPPGKFDFKAIGEEEVMARKTWRIAVDGTIEVRDFSVRAAGEAIEKARGEGRDRLPVKKLPNLVSTTQKVKGDVWFDANAGQVVKADLRLDVSTQARETTGKAANGDLNFNGNLVMELRKVAYAGNE